MNQTTDFLSSSQGNFWFGLVSFFIVLILMTPSIGYAQRSGLLQRKPPQEPVKTPSASSQLEKKFRTEDIKEMMRIHDQVKGKAEKIFKTSGVLDLTEELPPGPFRDLYKDSLTTTKGKGVGGRHPLPDFVNKSSNSFKELLNKSELMRIDVEAARELAEASKLSEQFKKPDILKLKIKEIKDQGEYFTARLYELDPVTRRTIMEWYNEIVKNPEKLQNLLQNIPEENIFFGASATMINIVFGLGDDWIVIAHLLQDGTVQLGYVVNLAPSSRGTGTNAIKPLQKASEKPVEVPIAADSQQQLQITRTLFENKINRLNEKLKEKGKTVIVTDDVAHLDIILSDTSSIGGNVVRPEEYDTIFGKENADSLRRVRDSYRRRWEDQIKESTQDKVNPRTQQILKDLRNDLEGRVYLKFGGETEKKTGIRWPDDIEDGTYLAVKRDEKITALSKIYDDYRNKGISTLLESYGLDFVFRGLHQASPLNDVIIMDKTGNYMWLDDFIKAGFPKTIQ